MNLKEKIERARAEAKEEKAQRPAEPTLKVKGFWQKKNGDKETHSSFVARITGIGYDQHNDRETLELEFKHLYSEIEWTSKKGSMPEESRPSFYRRGSTKRVCSPPNRKRNRTGSCLPSEDGKEEPLTEAEVFHIFQDGTEEPEL